MACPNSFDLTLTIYLPLALILAALRLGFSQYFFLEKPIEILSSVSCYVCADLQTSQHCWFCLPFVLYHSLVFSCDKYLFSTALCRTYLFYVFQVYWLQFLTFWCLTVSLVQFSCILYSLIKSIGFGKINEVNINQWQF